MPPRDKRMLNDSSGLGRITLITGAASERGFGHHSAVLLASHGARVAVTDLPKFEEQGRKVVEEIERDGGQAIWIPLDVTKEEDWKRAIKIVELKWGPLDVLVNNAGIGNEYQKYMYNGLPESIAKHPTSDWMRVIAVNQHGVYFGIREGAGSMLKNTAKEAKSIINFSSTAGLMGGTPFAYSASKWAVRGMTKHAALTLAPHGIRVNSIHPGVFHTNINQSILGDNPSVSPDVVKMIKERWDNLHPMGRIGDPREAAQLVLYLASSESSFTTGAEHVIDGGWMTTAGFLENPFKKSSSNL